MRGQAKVFTLASVALLSCRAVLGIEEIEEGTADGGTGTPDAAADSVGTDSANPDTAPPIGDGGTVNQACINTCRVSAMGTPALPAIENIAKTAGCICGPGLCTTECGTICSGTGAPSKACIDCLDPALLGKKPECATALQNCVNDNQCKTFGTCLQGCRN